MNKILTAAALAASTALGGHALAADIPRKTIEPAPFVQPSPIFTWTGVYVGINGGYVFGTGQTRSAIGPFSTGELKTLGEGFTVGGTLGVNYQINNIVLGLETDLNYVDLGKTVTSVQGGMTTTVTRDMSYLGTVRGRLGVSFDRALIYVTGGLAYGNPESSTAFSFPPFGWNGADNATRFGYAVGAGLEYAIDRNWSAKVEYMYYDLGRRDYASPQVAGAALGIAGGTRSDNDGHLVRAGINYRF
jgi:outer membrane immunogenic protein